MRDHKKIIERVGIALIIVGSILLFVHTQTTSNLYDAAVTLGNQTFHTTVVEKDPEMKKGLSGSSSLAKDEAMLFIFPTVAKHGMWMKDMQYPIDIIWLDEEARVISIKTSAQPRSYPKETFTPSEPARYVLEIADGAVKKYTITIGMQADIRYKEKKI